MPVSIQPVHVQRHHIANTCEYGRSLNQCAGCNSRTYSSQELPVIAGVGHPQEPVFIQELTELSNLSLAAPAVLGHCLCLAFADQVGPPAATVSSQFRCRNGTDGAHPQKSGSLLPVGDEGVRP